MANIRGRSQFHVSYVAKAVSLYASVSFGASGAPTLVSGTGMGIVSITRSSAGRYVLALTGPYGALLGVRHAFVKATAPTSPSLYIVADATASLSAPSITIQFNAAGTATDPASGEVALIELVLADTGLSY